MSKKVKAVAVPLVEAVVEVRFSGDAALESARGEFQSKIRDRFPQLAVPLAEPAKAPALQHYRFVNAEDTEFVGLALNSFVLSTREYPGWETFLEKAKSLWTEIPRFSPPTLTRVGLRYINVFQEAHLASVRLDEPHGLFEPIKAKPQLHRSVSVISDDGNTLTVNLEYAAAPPRLVVDYDCSRENVPPDKLWDVVCELHERVEREFFSLLVPEYRDELQS